MRKRIAAKNTRVPPVRFHLEDLTELVAVFTKYCESVEISDDKAIYDSLIEAAERVAHPVTNLEIAGKNPGIVLSLKKDGSWLAQRFDKPSMENAEIDQSDLAYIKIKEFLDGYRPDGMILSGPFPTLIIIAVIVGVAATVAIRGPAPYGEYAFISGWVLVMAWMALLRTRYMDIGVVSLKPKGAVTTFWSRNKDGIRMLIIGAGIGTFATLLGKWLAIYIRTK